MWQFSYILALLTCVSANNGLNQRLLVVSFDAFREVYLDEDTISKYLVNLNQFRSTGVFSNNTISVYPSDTFPNHFSIATGCWAETHGIVSNRFYDPVLNDSFDMNRLEPKFWNAVEPIWVTARRQGKRTSVNYWPGSNVKYPPEDYLPDYYRPVYDASVPFELRLDETIGHLVSQNVDLAFLYLNQPDAVGHKFGVTSREIELQLYQVDWFMSYLMNRLDSVGLGKDKLNVIIVADHGMVNITRNIQLADYTNISENIDQIPTYGSITHIVPKEGKTDSIYGDLKRGELDPDSKERLFTVYKKSDIPPNFHLAANVRIPEIVVFCETGIRMSINGRPSSSLGGHGYNPLLKAMRPVFMARGPAFKSGGYRVLGSFYTKDIHAIIAHVVGLKPPSTNASWDSVAEMFSNAANIACQNILLLMTCLIASIRQF